MDGNWVQLAPLCPPVPSSCCRQRCLFCLSSSITIENLAPPTPLPSSQILPSSYHYIHQLPASYILLPPLQSSSALFPHLLKPFSAGGHFFIFSGLPCTQPPPTKFCRDQKPLWVAFGFFRAMDLDRTLALPHAHFLWPPCPIGHPFANNILVKLQYPFRMPVLDFPWFCLALPGFASAFACLFHCLCGFGFALEAFSWSLARSLSRFTPVFSDGLGLRLSSMPVFQRSQRT